MIARDENPNKEEEKKRQEASDERLTELDGARRLFDWTATLILRYFSANVKLEQDFDSTDVKKYESFLGWLEKKVSIWPADVSLWDEFKGYMASVMQTQVDGKIDIHSKEYRDLSEKGILVLTRIVEKIENSKDPFFGIMKTTMPERPVQVSENKHLRNNPSKISPEKKKSRKNISPVKEVSVQPIETAERKDQEYDTTELIKILKRNSTQDAVFFVCNAGNEDLVSKLKKTRPRVYHSSINPLDQTAIKNFNNIPHRVRYFILLRKATDIAAVYFRHSNSSYLVATDEQQKTLSILPQLVRDFSFPSIKVNSSETFNFYQRPDPLRYH